MSSFHSSAEPADTSDPMVPDTNLESHTNLQSPFSGSDHEVAIRVQNLIKTYRLYNTPMDRLKESLHPLRRKYHHGFNALNDVSFEVKKGESVGIIGKNGSGKSTLLKIITGVLTPSAGVVRVVGKISALLELGAGFNPELTGLENVYFNGTLMGYSREEIDAKLEGVLAFADIGEFINQPVKTYSSGMFVRLAFATAISVEPEILIVDEALSVGDIFFQQKCYAKIREIISRGTTCLFVSHDTTAMMNLCTKAILLDNGAVDYEGPAEGVVSRYFNKIGPKVAQTVLTVSQERSLAQVDDDIMSASEIMAHSILTPNTPRHGEGGLRIVAARVTDSHGRDTFTVNMMETLFFYVLLKAYAPVCNTNSGIIIYDRLGNMIFTAGSSQLKQYIPKMTTGDELVLKTEITFTVQPGEYTFGLGASIHSSKDVNSGITQDRLEQLGPIRVIADQNEPFPFFGLAQLPMRVSMSEVRKTNIDHEHSVG